LLDGGHAVQLVAWIDTLGAVACVKIFVEAQARHPLQNRDAVFFGGSGVNRGLVNNDVTPLEHFSDGFTGTNQGCQVGLLEVIDRRGYRHDVYVRSEEHTSELQSR